MRIFSRYQDYDYMYGKIIKKLKKLSDKYN